MNKEDTHTPHTHTLPTHSLIHPYLFTFLWVSHTNTLEVLLDLSHHIPDPTLPTINLVDKKSLLIRSCQGVLVWTLGMFQMVTGESYQCIRHTKQTDVCHVGVRHSVCTVPKYGFVIWNQTQNTSNRVTSCKRNNYDYQGSEKSWLSKVLIIKTRSLSDYQMFW
jgi:hypothetical protein